MVYVTYNLNQISSFKVYLTADNFEFDFFIQEMMERALMKQRAGIVQKQVAAGREFQVSAENESCHKWWMLMFYTI